VGVLKQRIPGFQQCHNLDPPIQPLHAFSSHPLRPLLDQRNFKGKLEELKTEEKKSA
jgi:hypothetical protein